MDAAADKWAEARATAVVNVLANAAAAAVEFEDAEAARDVLATVAGDRELLAAALRTGDRKMLASLGKGAEQLLAGDGSYRVEHHGDELWVTAPVVGRSGAHG